MTSTRVPRIAGACAALVACLTFVGCEDEAPELVPPGETTAEPPEAAPEPVARFDRPAPYPGRPGPPERMELYSILMENADVELSEGEHCTAALLLDHPRPLVVGDWFAWNLAVMEEDPLLLPTHCTDEGEHWACEVTFRAGGAGDSPWTCGFRFSVRKEGRRPDPTSLVCSGVC